MPQYQVETVETMHRQYRVDVDEGLKGEEAEKQARNRAHLHFRDPSVMREGLIRGPIGDDAVTSRKVVRIAEVGKSGGGEAV